MVEIEKHPPPRLATTDVLTVYLSTNTPFVSGVKRVKRSLEKMQKRRRGRYVIVYGMGKAIQRTLAVAMELQTQGHRIKLYTRTMHALDEHVDAEAGSAEMIQRAVGAVEIHVYAK